MNMKKISLVLLALVALTARAQVTEGVTWYDGELGYSARNMAAGKVLMNAMAEGEELEFMLVPIAGKKDSYQVTDGPNDCVNPYSEIATVRRMKEGKLDVLCFYDEAGRLQAVFSDEGDVWNTDELNRDRWMGQLAGEYFFNEVEGETRIGIYEYKDEDGRYGMRIDGVETTINVVTFNGSITGFIRISEMGGTIFTGTWKVIQTVDGLTLREVEDDPDEYFFDWKPTGMEYFLTKADRGKGTCRFDYATTQLLNDRQFRSMDKAALRVMRNYILARHGYKFSSADLQEYFTREPWYTPRESNDGISDELSLVERLNIELIKAVEAKAL